MADIHVLPLKDAIAHTDTRGCWCQPTVTETDWEDVVVIHHSADGRELFEAEALPPATRH